MLKRSGFAKSKKGSSFACMLKYKPVLSLAFLICLIPLGLRAHPTDDAIGESESTESSAKKVEESSIFPAEPSVTHHTVTIGGEEISYTATVGTLTLRDGKEEPTAKVFYIAYTRDGLDDLTERPLTFSFNGGPGSSSVWLHMGILGPKRVLLDDLGNAPAPPYRLTENEYSLLDTTDLVFIDPVSTGFSRSVDPEKAGQFHGVEGDLRSVAEFIRLYTTRHERWTSPKFLIGESYGTTRAAGLAETLAEEHRLYLNGIMLVSAVLNFQTIRFREGNDLPFVLYFPSYTATAYYHQKLPDDLLARPLREVLDEAEAFAKGPYLQALFEGDRQDADSRQKVLSGLSRYTGIDEQYFIDQNLRPVMWGIATEMLRDEGKVIGRFDGRYTGPVRSSGHPLMPYDPSGTAIDGIFAATFHDYVRGELGFVTDRPYEILTGNVHPWDWGTGNNYINTAEPLADVLTQQPFLQVHVSNGYTDLATPYYATEYTFAQLELPPEVRERIHMDYFDAGHMMYLNLPDLKKQKKVLAEFIERASRQN
jgi:carboxypeptidase C (cathepsin A)